MNYELLGAVILAAIGIGLSALFSGLETGLYTLNRVRLSIRADQGERLALMLRKVMIPPNRMLSTLLIGNNIANYAGSFGLALILDHYGMSPVQAIIVNACILVPLLFIFGETLPKDFFRTYTDRWSYFFAPFLRGSERLLTWTGLNPLTQWFGDFAGWLFGAGDGAARTARQRMSQLIKEGTAAGLISEAQTTLADRALAMRDMKVEAEMVPWPKATTLPIDADPDQREKLLRQTDHARVPVVDRRGRVLGIVRVMDLLLQPERDVPSLMRDVEWFPPGTNVRRAMRQMQKKRIPMAVVARDQHAVPIGLMTLKDLVEPLTGEIAPWS
ncbi:MAG: DUF21 domain-containing protein [Phycisphaerales bacterium]|nr:MAG: DUF21 domain-containing protein [Phycisphaerales bacterium]